MGQTGALEDIPLELANIATEHGDAFTSSEVKALIGKLQSWA